MDRLILREDKNEQSCNHEYTGSATLMRRDSFVDFGAIEIVCLLI